MHLGTHQWVSAKHVDDDLAEFTHRAKRQWLEACLFDRHVVAALDSKALTYKQSTTGVTYRIRNKITFGSDAPRCQASCL